MQDICKKNDYRKKKQQQKKNRPELQDDFKGIQTSHTEKQNNSRCKNLL